MTLMFFDFCFHVGVFYGELLRGQNRSKTMGIVFGSIDAKFRRLPYITVPFLFSDLSFLHFRLTLSTYGEELLGSTKKVKNRVVLNFDRFCYIIVSKYHLI